MPEPLLTIIVPAYRVVDCVDECLASILDQAGSDIEVVTVDDASPDRCGEILDAWAARDARVAGRHLAVNAASDPRATPASNSPRPVRLVRRQRRHDPGRCDRGRDPPPSGAGPGRLLIDHVRTYPDGTVAHDAHGRLLRGVDGRFPLADHPELLGLQHTAWSRIVRRTSWPAPGSSSVPAGTRTARSRHRC